jgi:hypothetical protein
MKATRMSYVDQTPKDRTLGSVPTKQSKTVEAATYSLRSYSLRFLDLVKVKFCKFNI